VITGNGIFSLCEDLDVDPMSMSLLVLFFKLNCQKKFEITPTEFFELRNQGIHKFEDMKRRIPQFDKEIFPKNHFLFRPFLDFIFRYYKEPHQKNLLVDVAIALWVVIFKNSYKYLDDWIEFLRLERNQKAVKAINLDQWKQFYEFTLESEENIFGKYNLNEGSYPLIIDDFISYLRDRQKILSAITTSSSTNTTVTSITTTITNSNTAASGSRSSSKRAASGIVVGKGKNSK